MEYAWLAMDPWQVEESHRFLNLLASEGIDSYANQFTLEGMLLSSDDSTGLVCMVAVAALAADPEIGKSVVQQLWDPPIPSDP
jgi:oligosaccharide reducing-end xylanase